MACDGQLNDQGQDLREWLDYIDQVSRENGYDYDSRRDMDHFDAHDRFLKGITPQQFVEMFVADREYVKR